MEGTRFAWYFVSLVMSCHNSHNFDRSQVFPLTPKNQSKNRILSNQHTRNNLRTIGHQFLAKINLNKLQTCLYLLHYWQTNKTYRKFRADSGRHCGNQRINFVRNQVRCPWFPNIECKYGFFKEVMGTWLLRGGKCIG